jgi:hypothetical protein
MLLLETFFLISKRRWAAIKALATTASSSLLAKKLPPAGCALIER